MEPHAPMGNPLRVASVYQIKNGFLLETMEGVTFCANSEDISKHIIAHLMRKKLDTPIRTTTLGDLEQYELPLNNPNI